jgi:hypothetical protein
MVLFDHCCAALFTGEGKATRDGGHLQLGPLDLAIDSSGGALNFRGPAVIVNDGAAYLSVESALARSSLDSDMIVAATIEIDSPAPLTDAAFDVPNGRIERTLGAASNIGANDGSLALYGRLRGSITVGGVRREINAVARVGASFTGLEPHRFETRRMLWACFDAPEYAALEARAWTFAEAPTHATARTASNGEWRECKLTAFDLETPAPGAPPDPFSAGIITPDGGDATLHGVAEAFMTLSRPGPDHVRIHTSIGFASYRIGTAQGAGMFEYSRTVSIANSNGDDDDSDSD